MSLLDAFSYNYQYSPQNVDIEFWTNGYYVGTKYEFKMQNDKDYLLLAIENNFPTLMTGRHIRQWAA